MKTFAIADWDAVFENSRSRSVKDLAWVGMPNKHDGEGFSLVMAHPRAAEIFAAWVLLVQVASKCKERGALVKDNGVPHTAQSLAIKTRSKAEWFEIAFEFLAQAHIGWLTVIEESVQEDVTQPSPEYQAVNAVPSPIHQEPDDQLSSSRHPGDTLPSPACHPPDGEVSAGRHEGDTVLSPGYQEPVTTRKEGKEGIEGEENTTSLRSVGDGDPPPQRARSEPFDSVKDVLVSIASHLDLPEPNDSEVRQHLRKDSPLRNLVEKLGVDEVAKLYCWVARHIPKGLSWPQIWSNHASLVSQMRSGVDPVPRSGSGSLRSHLDRINAEEAEIA